MNKKIVWLPYDFDTAIGINNEGSLTFGYELEDTDHLSGGADVFNGQDSVVWNNIRDAFGEELAAMYRQLRSEGKLSYSVVEKMFEDHQDKWPEAIFNEDSWFKYIDPLTQEGKGDYLPMLQGSKEEQRKWWLFNRFRYIDSKYNAGDALSDLIQIRGYAKSDITVIPYADIYPSVKYGSYLVQKRGHRGESTTLICPLDNVNDTEIYIYSASQLASVGDLSGFKVGFADFSMATKLQALKLGDASETYNNPNLKTLTLGNNVLLKTVDVRNCSGLGTGDAKTVNLSGCVNIENVYFDGTAITGVDLPNGGILKVLHLPATVTNLSLMNQTALTDLTIPSYANISTLRIENGSSAIDSKAMVKTIPAAARVRLIGIAWSVASKTELESLLDTLDTMRGLDEHGNNVDTAQVSGTIHVTGTITGDDIAAWKARYPYINYTADSIAVTLSYYNYDGTSLITTEQVVDGGDGTYAGRPSRSSTAQYTYTFVGWNTQQDAQVAESGCTTNVVADRTVYAAYSRTVRKYTVTWKNSDGTVLETDTDVPYGATPQYNGATPQNPTSGGGNFVGWSPAISTVTGNVTYTASYIPTYTVRFYNGTTLLETVTVQKGQAATYSGTTPVNPEDADLAFTGWNPNPTNVQANMDCYAQFKAAVVVEEISDTWDQILAACANGTAATKYKLGNYKPLDLGAQGIVNMQIVGRNIDALASGIGNAQLSWMSMELLASSHNMNSYNINTGGWEGSAMRTWLRRTVKPLIPANVAAGIKEVTKYSYRYDTKVTDAETTDDVWIPSGREVNLSANETMGPKYADVFPDNASRIKKKAGAESASTWWLRSAYNTSSSGFNGVSTDGSSSFSGALNGRGVTLGFCT